MIPPYSFFLRLLSGHDRAALGALFLHTGNAAFMLFLVPAFGAHANTPGCGGTEAFAGRSTGASLPAASLTFFTLPAGTRPLAGSSSALLVAIQFYLLPLV